ncbi:uncharacterized protein GIQ15_01882 [Arthroderma uncinatum]|uniref:uncharacterized protein n=1 Tax=Arthroderma uncinatum TaxID=74035 RepID=UPI00144A935D|nr:uncharacterized protein GIQ15_01882 [Arthroderma uncinatum]KAF3492365.1 hypothetical protein GIQ15_01882 [Arthroderma uncinatum]
MPTQEDNDLYISDILDNFIDEAYEGILRGDDGINTPVCPCILQTTDLRSISHGSRKPMPEFVSPFLNKTDEEIRDWMLKHPYPGFAEGTFTVLDQQTIDSGLSRIGYCGEKSPDPRMLISDPYADLIVRASVEMCESDWEEEVAEADGVRTRKEIEQGF